MTGCYECSQRRVNCDRGEPDCAKCVSKGLECSGIDNSKFKFRNRFVGSKGNSQRRLSHSSGSSHRSEPDVVVETKNVQSPEHELESCYNVLSDGNVGYQMNFDFWDDPATSLCCSPPMAFYTLDHIKPHQHVLLEHCKCLGVSLLRQDASRG